MPDASHTKQIWVALGDNLAVVEANLQSYGPNASSEGLITTFYVGWNVVSAVLGHK